MKNPDSENFDTKNIKLIFKSNKLSEYQINDNQDIPIERIINLKHTNNYRTVSRQVIELVDESVKLDKDNAKQNKRRKFLKKLFKFSLFNFLKYKIYSINSRVIQFNKFFPYYVNELDMSKQKIHSFRNKSNQVTKNIQQKINDKCKAKFRGKGNQIFLLSQHKKFKLKQQQINSLIKIQNTQNVFHSLQEMIHLLKKDIITINYFNQSSCPGCVSFFQQYSAFGFDTLGKFTQNNVIFYESFFKQSEANLEKQLKVAERTKLEKALCALLNMRKGYIFIGIDRDQMPYIQGMQLTTQLKQKFEREVKKIIKQYIGPEEQTSQIFNNIEKYITIKYIPVLKNLTQLNLENPQLQLSELEEEQIQSIIFENYYVIRIKVDIPAEYEKYFFYVQTKTLGSAEPQYKFFMLKNCKGQKIAEQIDSKQFYKTMVRKYKKQANYSDIEKHDHHIRCSQPLELKQKKIENQEIKVKDYKYQKFTHGKAPQKKYNHQTIMVVTNKGMVEGYYKKYRELLQARKIDYECQQVYEKLKLKKISSRSVFYLTHPKKFDVLQKILAQLQGNSKKIQIFLFDVRKQLVLVDFNDRQKALQTLLTTFKLEFDANICYGRKQYFNPKLGVMIREFFLSFFHHTYAIFAFIALEYQNIRCNFVNNSKLDGIPLEQI